MGNKNARLKEVKRVIKNGAFRVKNALANAVQKMKKMIVNFLSKLSQPLIKLPLRSQNGKNGQSKETNAQSNSNQSQSKKQKDAQNDAYNNFNNSNQAEQHDNEQGNNHYNKKNNNWENGSQQYNESQQNSDGHLVSNVQQSNQMPQEEFDKIKEALLDSKQKREQPNINARETTNTDNQQRQINEAQDDCATEAKKDKQTTVQSVQITTKQSAQAVAELKQNPQGNLQAVSKAQNEAVNESTAYKEGQDEHEEISVAEYESVKATQATYVSQSKIDMKAANMNADDAQVAVQVVSTPEAVKKVSEPLPAVTLLDMLDSILPNFSEEPVSFGNLNQDEEKVNDIIARNIIQKFVKMRFKSSNSQLNTRQSAMEKVSGVSKWDTMQVVKHKTTKEYNKMLKDKYDYDYGSGKQEQIPLSIYIDLSPSMDKYIPLLTTIAMQLLKNGVRVIIGTNEEAKLQINEIPPNMTKFEFNELIVNHCYTLSKCKKNAVKFEILDCNIGRYLTKNKAEKTLVFSDYDPSRTICDLSRTKCNVYWFNFAGIRSEYLKEFKGVICAISNSDDILKAISLFTNTNYNALAYKQPEIDLKSTSKKVEYNNDYYL